MMGVLGTVPLVLVVAGLLLFLLGDPPRGHRPRPSSTSLDGPAPPQGPGSVSRPQQETTMAGPAERYVRGYTLARQTRTEQGWTEMEQALVMTLIDWKCDSEMRPSSGPGSDCSDLMDVALGRLLGLARGRLTPQQVLDAIEEAHQ